MGFKAFRASGFEVQGLGLVRGGEFACLAGWIKADVLSTQANKGNVISKFHKTSLEIRNHAAALFSSLDYYELGCQLPKSWQGSSFQNSEEAQAANFECQDVTEFQG